MPAVVYRIRAAVGAGWVREVVKGVGPIITGLEAEAGQWADRAVAERIVAAMRRRGLTEHVVVAGPPTVRVEWGRPGLSQAVTRFTGPDA